MRAVVLAGGYGGAKFALGLRTHLNNLSESGSGLPVASDTGPPTSNDLAVVTNTADDIRLHGLHISPDLDTVMYTLGGGLDTERGWGRADEGFRIKEELAAYSAGAAWFGLGDRDLATHLLRTQMHDAGYSLTQVTAALCKRWQPGVRLLPMTDDRVETHVLVDGDETERAIHFQEWWIRHKANLKAHGFVQIGIQEAAPTDEVRSAIADAELIVVAPSNPVVSIGPIVAVPGMAAALRQSPAPIIGISPIIAGRPLRGMADKCLAAIDVPSSAAAVAAHYGARSDGGLLDAWLIDEQDELSQPAVAELGISCTAVPTVMNSESTAADLAAETIAAAQRIVEKGRLTTQKAGIRDE
jgi:LPPG:FO 2-phospho-L-lactate transferase